MKTLFKTLNQNATYFWGYCVFAFILTLLCFSIPKSEGFLFINKFHCKWLDYFFILFTNLGNGLFTIAIIAVMLIRRKKVWSLQLTLGFLFSGLIVQILKILVRSPRPEMYFGATGIHFIQGITGTGFGSFPSGHAATVFGLTTLLSIYFPGKKPALFLLLIGILTGFSRIYLAQHFPVDVLVGSAIGVLISTGIYILIPGSLFRGKFSKSDFRRESAKLL